jgi:hypothetical protein
MPRLVVLPIAISHVPADVSGNGAEPAVIRTHSSCTEHHLLIRDPGTTPPVSRMRILMVGKAMKSRTARLH